MDTRKRVTLGVCGGVAAYKAIELVRVLQRANADVQVVMTEAAEEFLKPLMFASVSGHPVRTSLWSGERGGTPEAAIDHILLAQETDVLVVAPATAHTLAKFAHGLADDYLSTLYLASTAPVVVAPAMNVNMLRHAATEANLATLAGRGVRIIAPGEGYLACGMVGGGRLAEVEEIAAVVLGQLAARADFSGEIILVTAGGTREAIDPVRFLGNRSSGKMGHELAEAAARRGARVILVTASVLPVGGEVETIRVTTAEEMRVAVLAMLPRATMVIGAAAVADYRPREASSQKIKRDREPFVLELEPTRDILRECVAGRRDGTLVIAFAAETQDLLNNARLKLRAKGVDAVVANDVSSEETGFETDRNGAIFVTQDEVVELPVTRKAELANKILNQVIKLRAMKVA